MREVEYEAVVTKMMIDRGLVIIERMRSTEVISLEEYKQARILFQKAQQKTCSRFTVDEWGKPRERDLTQERKST